MCSHNSSACGSTCVESSTVVPAAAIASSSSLSCRVAIGSSPVNGSSRIRNSGLMDHRPGELHLLLHPLRQLLDPGVRLAAEAELVEPRGRPAPRFRPRQAAHLPEVGELVEHLHPAVEAALLGEVADRLAQVVVDDPAAEADLAAVGERDAHDHPDRRRLPRAVGAEQAVDRPARDGKRQPIDRDRAGEALRNAGQLEVRIHPGPLPPVYGRGPRRVAQAADSAILGAGAGRADSSIG